MIEELEILKDFPIKIQIQVAWVEMDIYNHVNNTNYFRYFEEARVKYLEAIHFYHQYEKNGIACVISKASCNFMIPLKYPDILTVGARIVKIDKDCIHMEQFINSAKSGLAAFGDSELVIFNFKNSKPLAVPDYLKVEIEKLENKSFN
jgi:acyl-CoA thioester hydrolase